MNWLFLERTGRRCSETLIKQLTPDRVVHVKRRISIYSPHLFLCSARTKRTEIKGRGNSEKEGIFGKKDITEVIWPL